MQNADKKFFKGSFDVRKTSPWFFIAECWLVQHFDEKAGKQLKSARIGVFVDSSSRIRIWDATPLP